MIGSANPDAATKAARHAPGPGTTTVVTIAAVSEECWVVDTITWGYSAATGGVETLTIAYGTGPTTKLTLYIPNEVADSGPHQLKFPRGFHYDSKTKNEQYVVTLSSAAGVSGAVTVTYR